MNTTLNLEEVKALNYHKVMEEHWPSDWSKEDLLPILNLNYDPDTTTIQDMMKFVTDMTGARVYNAIWDKTGGIYYRVKQYLNPSSSYI